MSKHPRLMRRGAVYYFRCKIPADLVDHYDKREMVESLRTKNATEALRKVRIVRRHRSKSSTAFGPAATSLN